MSSLALEWEPFFLLLNYLFKFFFFSTWYVSFECLFHDVTYFKESKLHKMLNLNSITDLTPS